MAGHLCLGNTGITTLSAVPDAIFLELITVVRTKFLAFTPQVSTHFALDHQTYCALDQHTQITWTAQLTCDEHSRVGRWGLGLHYILIQHTHMDN